MKVLVKDTLTMANINLYAVLRNIQDLCDMDNEAKKLIEGKELGVLFRVRKGPVGRLIFTGGKCTFERGGGKHNATLYFTSNEKFNRMIEGKGNPIPLKGFTKLGFLTKEFTQLTDKLTDYLRADEEDLSNPTFFRNNTKLLFYTAFFALGEIGNHDPVGKLNAGRMPDGCIQVEIEEGPAVTLTVENGWITVEKGRRDHDASMILKNFETANGILNGQRDAFSCIASGELALSGYIPLLEHMNKLLGQVPSYLS